MDLGIFSKKVLLNFGILLLVAFLSFYIFGLYGGFECSSFTSTLGFTFSGESFSCSDFSWGVAGGPSSSWEILCFAILGIFALANFILGLPLHLLSISVFDFVAGTGFQVPVALGMYLVNVLYLYGLAIFLTKKKLL